MPGERSSILLLQQSMANPGFRRCDTSRRRDVFLCSAVVCCWAKRTSLRTLHANGSPLPSWAAGFILATVPSSILMESSSPGQCASKKPSSTWRSTHKKCTDQGGCLTWQDTTHDQIFSNWPSIVSYARSFARKWLSLHRTERQCRKGHGRVQL